VVQGGSEIQLPLRFVPLLFVVIENKPISYIEREGRDCDKNNPPLYVGFFQRREEGTKQKLVFAHGNDWRKISQEA